MITFFSTGRMIPEALELEIKKVKDEQGVPLLVCATAGTTVRGAFDPIDAIATICEKYNVFLHVDVCLLPSNASGSHGCHC